MTARHRVTASWRAAVRDPLAWFVAALLLLVFGMNALRPLFAAAFPDLQRPVFEQDSFVALTIAHLALVALSSAASILAGVAAGIFVTRPSGAEFRPLVESTVAMGQTTA